MSKSQVVLIVGYPASGKSTLAEEFKAQGYEYLNRDQRGGKVTDMVVPMMNFLKAGKNVVLDNTFPDRSVRQPFVDAAYRVGAEIHCLIQNDPSKDQAIVDAQVNACHRMIERCGSVLTPEQIKTTRQPNIFPPAVLFKYKKQYETPTDAEGFHSIEYRKFKRIVRPGYTNRALIVDYDGTLRESVGDKQWPEKVSDVKLLPRRKEKVAQYKELGFSLLLGASNQSAIAKGLDEQVVIDCFKKTNDLLEQDIDVIYCPHRIPPMSCFCRKPMPGMGIHFIEKYKLDPSQCLYVGDMTQDKTFARRCGFQFQLAEAFFGE